MDADTIIINATNNETLKKALPDDFFIPSSFRTAMFYGINIVTFETLVNKQSFQNKAF